jgi:hypothetical protein
MKGGISKMKFLRLTILMLITLSILFTACSNNSSNDSIDPSVDQNPNKEEETYIDNGFGWNISDPYIKELVANRTDWNIELSFVKCTDQAIVIRICDYDNQSYVINDLYYELEYLENEKWIKISYMNRDAAYRHLVVSVPSQVDDFTVNDSYNRFAFMPDVTLKSGHYRLTKVLSGKDFSVEFDLNFD